MSLVDDFDLGISSGMSVRPIIASILITLPFLGIEMSPIAKSWAASITIWAIWAIVLMAYHLKTIMRARLRWPITLRQTSHTTGHDDQPLPSEQREPRQSMPPQEFFKDRSDMISTRGSLDNELRAVGSAWLAFETGMHFSGIDKGLVPKVRRILMLDPTCQLLRDWTSFNGSTDQAVAAIKAVTRLCLPFSDTQVKWTTKPMMNCVIGDPDSDSAWVRINCQIPSAQAAKWPGYMVYRKLEPERFQEIKTYYDAIWNDATPPQQSVLDSPN